ncbi:MAG: CPBP family intramembrane metalloprotease [Massilibacteroides sp.]|nr:CPBP family intramembrane metalloprotease [Massilibacteroides sp.]MDD3062339.1 CPBP family intramembrane metalloprotease [Massilibacteroides sp.]MDD4660691.1 CPBP family intramembrane metalloprotease [Massilibacteroides sp.]
MKFKALFSNKSGLFQLWILLFLMMAGVILASLLTILLGFTDGNLTSQDPGVLRLIQSTSVFCSFLFPTLGLAWLCSYSPADYLSLNRLPSSQIFIAVTLALFLLSPLINLTALLNQQIVLPSWMHSLESWMQAKEQEMETIVQLLIREPGIGALFSNLLVIALLAALTEEFLFRGAIQRILEKWTNNHHLVIWIAAILFSAIHLQFYGFIPRLLLGAYFGYLLYWSKSIWLPVFAHFLNNAVAVLAERDQQLSQNEFISGDIQADHLFGYSTLTLIACVLFYFLNKQIRAKAVKENQNTFFRN